MLILFTTSEFLFFRNSLMRYAVSGGFRYNTHICSNSNIHPTHHLSPTSSSCSILYCPGKETWNLYIIAFRLFVCLFLVSCLVTDYVIEWLNIGTWWNLVVILWLMQSWVLDHLIHVLYIIITATTVTTGNSDKLTVASVVVVVVNLTVLYCMKSVIGLNWGYNHLQRSGMTLLTTVYWDI